MSAALYRELIERKAEKYGLPWPLVMAVVDVESSGNPWAYRYEPAYQWLVGQGLTPTEQMAQRTSWGLMQVMGAVAREYGFKGWLTELCQPDVGLEYGCRHLKRYADRYRNWLDAIAAYNAGSPRKAGDVYVNQSYVDKVMRQWDEHDQPVQTKETEV